MSVSSWTVRQVCSWLESSGFPDQLQRFEEHGVTGAILLNLDHDTLKDRLLVRSVGRRITLLNAVYQLKSLHQIPVDDGDYEPVSKRSSPARIRFESGSPGPTTPNRPLPDERSDELSQLESALHERDDTVNRLSQEIRRLNFNMGHIRADLTSLWKVAQEKHPKPVSERSSPLIFPSPSPHDPSSGAKDQQEEKSFRILPDDACHKVLKSALNPYKLDEEWREYALFIVYGKEKRNERCLNYDEKPHRLFERLKDANEAPVLVLKHIKHLPSPVHRKVTGPGIKSDESSEEGKETGTNRKAALAVYEYTAERDDELDVSIGDEFAIRSRPDVGWCVVERKDKVGWVPEAVLEDVEKDELEGSALLKGISLFDYKKTGPNELNVKKDDVLLIRKKYRHWLVADFQGRKGWVPSCYVTYDRNRLHEVGPLQQSDVSGANPITLRMDSARTMTPSMDSHIPDIHSHGESAKPSPEHDDVSPTFHQRIPGDVPARKSAKDEMGIRDKGKKSGGRESTRSESEPVSSPAVAKLSVLLENINPYMEEGKLQTRLDSALADLNSSLLKWRSELEILNEFRGGEDPLSEALDLTDLVGTLSNGSPNRPKIVYMLEGLVREKGHEPDYIGEDGRLQIRSKIDRTFEVLTKVVDVLFKDQAATSGNG